MLFEKFEKPNNYINSVTYIYALCKICFLTVAQIQKEDEKIFMNLPTTVTDLFNEFYKITSNFIKMDKEKANDFIEKIYQHVFSFKRIHPFAFNQCYEFAKLIINANMQKNITYNAEVFCKYSANALLYHEQSLLQRNNNFFIMISYIKIPSKGDSRWRLIELFFISFFLELKELRSILEKMEKKCSRSDLKTFIATIDSFNKIIVFFDAFLKNRRSAQEAKVQASVPYFDPGIDQRVSHLITMIFAEILFMIEVCRRVMDVMEDKLFEFQADAQYETNM